MCLKLEIIQNVSITMALSDAQVSKQIEQMISFIQKESEEKIEEIETKVFFFLKVLEVFKTQKEVRRFTPEIIV